MKYQVNTENSEKRMECKILATSRLKTNFSKNHQGLKYRSMDNKVKINMNDYVNS